MKSADLNMLINNEGAVQKPKAVILEKIINFYFAMTNPLNSMFFNVD
jgi:hypothetical protein